ncbi:zinc/iron permease [Flexistipes sinusarabici DSM 4947]|uniref:Zinc/iron permease n=1 Tax=Flexistipes sinusarabici (strain ATCC 49648 / DSM 4947 / MAS 10) TaxID=717231 RepID=F8E5M8_FLESM|nr:ZIP family metal transporter [Flexistipes sinusarabici]AEI14659.1 zinc/iron permease [Flexistipes sinusarabici DSM 4947]
MNWFLSLSPVMQAFIATMFTYLMTAAGAAMVFPFKSINKKALNAMLGFAAGVMIAASFWSLLAPAIQMVEDRGGIAWIPAVVGFISGGFFLWVIDKILPHLHLNMKREDAEGISTSWQRSVLLVLAITLHNFPEGLAVGIGIQNFPEGAAVSVPLRREKLTRWKSFLYGQFSGVVEPIAGVIGALAVIYMRPMLPYALSFAAGAMIYVVVEELIPESQFGDEVDLSTIGAMMGFAVMMTLDVALG